MKGVVLATEIFQRLRKFQQGWMLPIDLIKEIDSSIRGQTIAKGSIRPSKSVDLLNFFQELRSENRQRLKLSGHSRSKQVDRRLHGSHFDTQLESILQRSHRLNFFGCRRQPLGRYPSPNVPTYHLNVFCKICVVLLEMRSPLHSKVCRPKGEPIKLVVPRLLLHVCAASFHNSQASCSDGHHACEYCLPPIHPRVGSRLLGPNSAQLKEDERDCRRDCKSKRVVDRNHVGEPHLKPQPIHGHSAGGAQDCFPRRHSPFSPWFGFAPRGLTPGLSALLPVPLVPVCHSRRASSTAKGIGKSVTCAGSAASADGRRVPHVRAVCRG